MSKQKYYFNDGQRYLYHLGANSERIIASRRFGKSDGIIAPRILRNVLHMPRSAGAIYGATFMQILTRTLPAAVASLNRMGYKNEVHFFIGRRAPRNLNWQTAYICPANFDHAIHFFNGSVINLISQDVKFSSNSLTLDWWMADEGRSIKKEKMFEELIPAVSGMVGKFDECPWHKGGVVVSDMPTNKQGEWILDEEKKMDKELIRTLEGTIAYLTELKSRKDPKYDKEIRAQERARDFLRRNALVYKEFDAFENLEILGESYIREQKRNLTPLIFQTSIMNRRIRKLQGGFYSSLQESVHYYDAFNNSLFFNQRTAMGSLDLTFRKDTCIQDADVDQNKPLSIAFDYNANINWVVTGQSRDGKLFTLSSMYVKYEQKLRELCRKWSTYYGPHPRKEVIYYYDSTAKQGSYASDQERFHDIVINTLTKLKWNVTPVDLGQPMEHKLKYQYIDDALKGIKYLFPMFNRENNEALLPAMEQAGIKIGRNGWEKDKGGEKLAETDDDPLELRTDGTDAWDVLFLGMTFHPIESLYTGFGAHWG
jgi:hypothetical protein